MARCNRFHDKRRGEWAQEWADLHTPGIQRADSKIGWTDMNYQQDTAASGGRQVLCELIETKLISCHVPVQGLQRRSLHNCDYHQSSEDETEHACDARNCSGPIDGPQDESICQV